MYVCEHVLIVLKDPLYKMILLIVLKRNALITSILTYLILDVFVYGPVGIDWVILKKDIYPQTMGPLISLS